MVQLGVEGRAYGKALFAAFDQDGNGQLTYREVFIGMSLLLACSNEERLRSAFMMMDADASGTASRAELEAFLRFIAPPGVSKADVVRISKAMLLEADTNRTGALSYPEFMAWPGRHTVLEWIDAFHNRVMTSLQSQPRASDPRLDAAPWATVSLLHLER